MPGADNGIVLKDLHNSWLQLFYSNLLHVQSIPIDTQTQSSSSSLLPHVLDRLTASRWKVVCTNVRSLPFHLGSSAVFKYSISPSFLEGVLFVRYCCFHSVFFYGCLSRLCVICLFFKCPNVCKEGLLFKF